MSNLPISALEACDLSEILLTSTADDILIKKDGYDNLTTAPKTIEEMEKIINSDS